MANNGSSAAADGRCCQVPGCKSSVVKDGHYFVRRRVCRKHCTADEIVVGDKVLRYCQQCSRLQPFDDFDAGRRSCRTSLAAHSQRRRLRGLGNAAAGKHGKASRSGSAGGSNSGSSQQQCSSNSADAVGASSTPGTSDQPAGDQQQQQQLQQQEGQQQLQQHVGTPSPGAAMIDKDSLLLPLDMPPLDQMLALPQQSVLPSPSAQPTKQQQQQQHAQAVAGVDHRKHYQQQQQRAQASAALPAAQHRRLQPGSVSEALLAAIGENIDQGLSPSPSMQGQQHPLAPAAAASHGRGSYGAASGRGAASVFGSASMDLPEGGLLYNTGTLVGSKRDREAMTQADIAAQFLGALEQRQQLQQQQRQQELLRLQRQRQQEQQQALYRQAPGLVQAPGCDSLASALLSNLGLNLPPQAPVYDDTTALDWAKLRNSGSNSGAHTSSSSRSRSRDPVVQQLMSVLRKMPAAGMPLLQMAMQREIQQTRAQRGIQHPQLLQTDLQLLQASMLAPSSRSPSSLAGTSAELSPSAQLTVSEAQTMSQRMRRRPSQLDGDSDSSSDGDTGPSTLRQRLTSLLKNLPPGGLPMLRAALQEAEQVPQGAADGGKSAVSSAGLRFPAGAHAQLQFAQQQQLAALTADQDVDLQSAGCTVENLFPQRQQQRMLTMPAGLTGAGAGVDLRANKRRAVADPATSYGVPGSVGLMPDVHNLMYRAPIGLTISATMAPAGARVGVPRSAPAMPGSVGRAAPLASDMLLPDHFGSL